MPTQSEQSGRIVLPPQVEELAMREKEVASAVYLEGGLTARELERRVSDKLSNAAIRSMLSRLCKKGILTRRKHSRSQATNDHRIPYIYLPTITPEQVRQAALQQLALDHFDGSMQRVAHAAIELLNRPQSERPARIAEQEEARPQVDVAA